MLNSIACGVGQRTIGSRTVAFTRTTGGSRPAGWMLLLLSSGLWGRIRLSGLFVEPGAEGGFQVGVIASPYLEST